MKRLKYYIASLLVLPCLISCNDFLERYPLDAMNDQSFFTSETDLEYYMNSLYNSHIIRNTIQQRWQNFTSGDDDVVFNSPNSFLMQHSSSGQADETSSTWNGAYDYLRSVNYFIANAPRVGAMTAIGKHYYGEGYYCRAAKYFSLLQTFGGVPYIDKVLGTDSEDLYTPRATRQYIAERIIEDLDIAIENLQWKGSGSATAGRINKEAALIMKSRVGLYEGSWEYYHGRKNTPFKASEDKSAFFLGKAVEAGQMLIDKHGGNLYKGSTGNEYFDYFTQYDYSNVPGAFLYKVYSRSLNVIQTWGRAYSEGFNGGLTRDAVDCYLMTDGKPAEISSVTYDPKLMNSLSENKDPRLDQTIWTPNKGRFADLMTTSNAYYSSYPGLIMNQQRNPTHSGYRIWKGTSFDASEWDNGEIDDLILRYEEGLLNFAEAKAILGTITQTDLDQSINYIRERVGMPGMNLSEITGWNINYSVRQGFDPSQSNIVNEIRRERRVELMLEGFRLDDIKRWAMLDDVFNGYMPVGAHIQEYLDYWNDASKLAEDGFDFKTPAEVVLTKGSNYNDIDGWINPHYLNSDFNPESVNARGYYVEPGRSYLNSIPRGEILHYYEAKGVVLEQNPGWF